MSISRNIIEHLFERISPGDSFWSFTFYDSKPLKKKAKKGDYNLGIKTWFLPVCTIYSSLKKLKNLLLGWEFPNVECDCGYTSVLWFSWTFYWYLLFFVLLPRRHLLVQSQQWEHQKNMWNLFSNNKKDTRTASLASSLFLCCWLWTDFTHPTSVSINNFEKVNTSRVRDKYCY